MCFLRQQGSFQLFPPPAEAGFDSGLLHVHRRRDLADLLIVVIVPQKDLPVGVLHGQQSPLHGGGLLPLLQKPLGRVGIHQHQILRQRHGGCQLPQLVPGTVAGGGGQIGLRRAAVYPPCAVPEGQKYVGGCLLHIGHSHALADDTADNGGHIAAVAVDEPFQCGL